MRNDYKTTMQIEYAGRQLEAELQREFRDYLEIYLHGVGIVVVEKGVDYGCCRTRWATKKAKEEGCCQD